MLAKEEVVYLLNTEKFYYTKYFGKAKNRTLYNDNIDLYKSLLFHTEKYVDFVTLKIRLNLSLRLVIAGQYKFNIPRDCFCKCGKHFIWDYKTKTFNKKDILYCKECLPKNKHSIEHFIARYGEIEGKIKFNECLDKKISNFLYKPTKGKSGVYYSKVSQLLFKSIISDNRIKKFEKDIKFAEHNGEEIIKLYDEERNFLLTNYSIKNYVYSIDFLWCDKIIEFDGFYWHKTLPENYDIAKDIIIEKRGFKVFRVKEFDYYKNPSLIVENCIKFLLED